MAFRHDTILCSGWLSNEEMSVGEEGNLVNVSRMLRVSCRKFGMDREASLISVIVRYWYDIGS